MCDTESAIETMLEVMCYVWIGSAKGIMKSGHHENAQLR